MNSTSAKRGNPFRGYPPGLENENARQTLEKTLQNLQNRLEKGKKALDLGEKNTKGTQIAEKFDIVVENTGSDDLDIVDFTKYKGNHYDYVFAFEILEHLFNPLHALLFARNVLKPDGKVFVTYPMRPGFLKFKGHFHEFDKYRRKALFERAGLNVVYETQWRIRRNGIWNRIGFRPILRKFLERRYFAELQKKGLMGEG